MRIGLALPHYDYSLSGERPLRFETLAKHASAAEAVGYDSLWLSDHLLLDLAKYGGSPEPQGVFEPLVTIAALARVVPRVRLGTLVLLEALRPAAVLAHALATLDRISDGRIDVGVGAGWYEPDYTAVGMAMPSPPERLSRLSEAVQILTALLAGETVTFDGAYHRADGARLLAPPIQKPRPPVFVGGKGDKLLRLAARHADGWNTCWVWTCDAYRERLDVIERECDEVGRDPSTLWRSVGLYALCGEDEHDLAMRFERLRAQSPPGVLDGMTLDHWRVGRLVGTVEQVREQAAVWSSHGVETLILGVGAVPFQIGDPDDVVALAEALGPVY